MADFGGFFKNRVRKIAYANRVAYAKSSRAGCDLRTQFLICVRDFCWDFTGCDLRTLGAICVHDLRTRFAYSTRFCVLDSNFRALLEYLCYFRFCVRDLRTRTRFFAPARIAYAKEFAYAKRRTTSAPELRRQTFLNAMPAVLIQGLPKK